MGTIIGVKTYDLRFPTSSTLSGSDAMNKDPRLSSAYVVITTDADGGLSGSGFVFTVGRGNDVVVAAIDPIAVATGEQMQNRIMYKQYLQAGSFKVMQIDATRVAGPQEIVLEYLLANKFGVRVCPPPRRRCRPVRGGAPLRHVRLPGGQWTMG